MRLSYVHVYVLERVDLTCVHDRMSETVICTCIYMCIVRVDLTCVHDRASETVICTCMYVYWRG